MNETNDIINEVCELARKSARGRQPSVSLSPEVADRLSRIERAAARPAPSAQTEQKTARGAEPELSPELAVIEAEVRVCQKCPLSLTRTNTVFGTGDSRAALVFVGEAPGHDEDLQGKPFVGRAGQLLTDIIKAMKLERADVFICNVLKCRPPNNRDPLPSEKDMCEPYLIRQLEAIRPKVICALGTHAAQTLLKTTEPIGKLRGRWHFYHGIPLRATYHPAYLLRNPADKKKTWADVQEVMKVYNGEVKPEP